ncbi:MAG: glycosyl transferase [Salinivirgaceae bacterium]|nr:MAG: glycosyl transferase [Salinivirgaceae bacterium]
MDFFKSDKGIQIIIAVVAGLFFIPFLGQVHLFDWDEINFAESAREMIVSGNYLTVQVNFEPFWEKPPLFIWMQVLSMKVFGINEFAARFPNAIGGIVTLLVLFNLGKHIYNKRFGLIWVLVYAGSFLPFFYFKSGIIDHWFNLFIFLGVYFILKYLHQPRTLFSILSAFFIGLSILTKGPVGFLIFLLAFGIYLIIKKFKVKIKWIDVGIYAVVLAFVGGFWFLLQILNGNYNIIVDFIEYQIHLFSKEGAGHGGFLLYHFVILFFGVFPASVFALKSFKRNYDESLQQKMRLMMVVLFWTVLILFTIVSTKIVHYSSMCYFPLTYLGAYIIFQLLEGELKSQRWLKWLVIGIGGIFVILIGAFPWIGKYAKEIAASGIIKDKFAQASMQANVEWTGFESIIVVILIATIFYFVKYWNKKELHKAFYWLFAGSIAFIFSVMTLITPKIEGYSQRAVIEFYKSKAGEDVYIEPIGFKSYAQYFYAQRRPQSNPKANNDGWLLRGDIDKKAWLVFKINRVDKYLKKYPELVKHSEKNGFVFCYRNPKK